MTDETARTAGDEAEAAECAEESGRIASAPDQEGGADRAGAEEDGRRRKRRGIALAAGLCGVALIAAVGVGAAAAMQPSEETGSEPPASAEAYAPADAKAALLVEADEGDGAATKMKCSIVDAEGAEVVEAKEIEVGVRTDMGTLEAGEYAVKVEAYPVLEDGSTYRLEDGADLGFEMEGSAVVVKVRLVHVPVEEMDEGEREAAAASLEAAEGAAPAAEPASSGGESGGAESPSDGRPEGGKSAHQHDWRPVTQWVPNIVTVVDAEAYSYDEPVYGDRCNYCGADVSGRAAAHRMQYETSDPNHAMASIANDVVIRYDRITVPAVTHTEDHGSEQATGAYTCSCGATK